MNYILRNKIKTIYKPLIWVIIIAFCSTLYTPLPNSKAYAQSVSSFTPIPSPQTLIQPTPAFNPTLIKGIKVFADNPLHFNFIIDRGDEPLQGEDLKEKSRKLIKYFLTSLTVPDDELWVNLSPNRDEAVITDAFGQTKMGEDMLAQDYQLKQLSASLLSPETPLGKDFWQRVYEKAYELYGTSDIPVEAFQKVWIVPDRARVYQNESSAFIVDSHLKVMMEEEYLSHQPSAISSQKNKDCRLKAESCGLQSELIKEIILPEIEREVNEGSHFANLRQIFHSMILATWYKRNLKQSIVNQIYSEQNKIKGVEVDDKEAKEKIYQRYLESIQKGLFNYVKEEYDAGKQEVIPRKYFSGGMKAWKKEIETVYDGAAHSEEVVMNPDEAMMADVNLVPEGKDVKQKAGEQLSEQLTKLNAELDSNLQKQDALRAEIESSFQDAEDSEQKSNFDQIDALEDQASALREQESGLRRNVKQVKDQIEVAASEDSNVAELFALAAAPRNEVTREIFLQSLEDNKWDIRLVLNKLNIRVGKKRMIVDVFERYRLLKELRQKLREELEVADWVLWRVRHKLNVSDPVIKQMLVRSDLLEEYKRRNQRYISRAFKKAAEKDTSKDSRFTAGRAVTRERILAKLELNNWNIRDMLDHFNYPQKISIYHFFEHFKLLNELKARIIPALEKNDGNKRLAAREIGITGSWTLDQLIKHLEIKIPEKSERIVEDLNREQIIAFLENNNWNLGELRKKIRSDNAWPNQTIYRFFTNLGLLDQLKSKVIEKLKKHGGDYKTAADEFGISDYTLGGLRQTFKITDEDLKETSINEHHNEQANPVKELTREEVLDILEKNDWNLKELREKLGTGRYWPHQSVYSYFSHLNLLDALKSKIIEKLRKHQGKYHKVAEEMGIGKVMFLGTTGLISRLELDKVNWRQIDVKDETVKSDLKAPEVNHVEVSTMTEQDLINWFNYTKDATLKSGGVLFGLTATKAEHGYRVLLYTSQNDTKAIYIRDDQVKGLYLGDRFNVVLAVYPDINQGPILGIFDEKSYRRWKAGEQNVYPIGTYSQKYRFTPMRTFSKEQYRRKPTIADMFVDDLKTLSEGNPITIRAPKFRWSYGRQILIVNKNKNRKGPMAAVRFGQQGNDIHNKTILRIPPEIVKKYHLQHKEQVIGVMMDHPKYGQIAQIYREQDFDEEDHAKSKNPLVTYGLVGPERKWQMIDWKEEDKIIEQNLQHGNDTGTGAKSATTLMSKTDVIKWLNKEIDLEDGNTLFGVYVYDVGSASLAVSIGENGVSKTLTIRRKNVRHIAEDPLKPGYLPKIEVVLRIYEDVNIGKVLGVFERKTFDQWLQGDPNIGPLSVYKVSARKAVIADLFEGDLKKLMDGKKVVVRGKYNPWRYGRSQVYRDKRKDGIVNFGGWKLFNWSSMYIPLETLDKYSIKHNDPVYALMKEHPTHGVIVQVFREQDFNLDDPDESVNPLVTYGYVDGKWEMIDLDNLPVKPEAQAHDASAEFSSDVPNYLTLSNDEMREQFPNQYSEDEQGRLIPKPLTDSEVLGWMSREKRSLAPGRILDNQTLLRSGATYEVRFDIGWAFKIKNEHIKNYIDMNDIKDVVLATYLHPYLGHVLGIFSKQEFQKWQNGNKDVFPLAVYGYRKDSRFPEYINLFAEQVKLLSEGAEFKERIDPHFMWHWTEKKVSVSENLDGQVTIRSLNKSIPLLISSKKMEKFGVKNGDLVQVLLVDIPGLGRSVQIFRNEDVGDILDNSKSLVTYSYLRGQNGQTGWTQIEDIDKYLADLKGRGNENEHTEETLDTDPLTASEISDWLNGRAELAPGRLLVGVAYITNDTEQKRFRIYEPDVDVLSVLGSQSSRHVEIPWNIANRFKLDALYGKPTVMATYQDLNLGLCLGIFDKDSYDKWQAGDPKAVPLVVYTKRSSESKPEPVNPFLEDLHKFVQGGTITMRPLGSPWRYLEAYPLGGKIGEEYEEGEIRFKLGDKKFSIFIPAEHMKDIFDKRKTVIVTLFNDWKTGTTLQVFHKKDFNFENPEASVNPLAIYEFNGERVSLRSIKELPVKQWVQNDFINKPGEREVYQYVSAIKEGTISDIQKAKNRLLKVEPFEMDATATGLYFGALNGQKVNIVIPGLKKARISVHEDPFGNPFLKIINLQPKKGDEKKVWYFTFNPYAAESDQGTYLVERQRPGVEEFTAYLTQLIIGNQAELKKYADIWSQIPKIKLKAKKVGEYREYGEITLARINDQDITIRLSGLEEAEIETAMDKDQKPYFILHPILKREGQKKKSKRTIEYAFKDTPGYIEESEKGQPHSEVILRYFEALVDHDKEKEESQEKIIKRLGIIRMRSPNNQFFFGQYKEHSLDLIFPGVKEIEVKPIEDEDKKLYFAVDFIETTDGRKREKEYYGIFFVANTIKMLPVNDATMQSLKLQEFKSDVREFYAQPMVTETSGKRRASRYFGTMQEYGPGRFDTVLDLRPFETTLVDGELDLNAYSYGNNLSTDFLKWKSTKARVTPILIEADTSHRSGMQAYLKVEGDYIDENGAKEAVYLYFNKRALRFNLLTDLPGFRALNSFWYALKSEYNSHKDKSLILAKEFSRKIDPFIVESTADGIIWEKDSYFKKPNIPINHQGPVEVSFVFDKHDEPYLKVFIPSTPRIPQQTIYFKMTGGERFFEEVKADQIEFSEVRTVTDNPLTVDEMRNWMNGQGDLSEGRLMTGSAILATGSRAGNFVLRIYDADVTSMSPTAFINLSRKFIEIPQEIVAKFKLTALDVKTVVTATYQDPNLGLCLGIFNKESYDKWQAGDPKAVPLVVYTKQSSESKPEPVDPFLEDLYKFTKGEDITLRPEESPWRYSEARIHINTANGQIEDGYIALGTGEREINLPITAEQLKGVDLQDKTVYVVLGRKKGGKPMVRVYLKKYFKNNYPDLSHNPLVMYEFKGKGIEIWSMKTEQPEEQEPNNDFSDELGEREVYQYVSALKEGTIGEIQKAKNKLLKVEPFMMDTTAAGLYFGALNGKKINILLPEKIKAMVFVRQDQSGEIYLEVKNAFPIGNAQKVWFFDFNRDPETLEQLGYFIERQSPGAEEPVDGPIAFKKYLEAMVDLDKERIIETKEEALLNDVFRMRSDDGHFSFGSYKGHNFEMTFDGVKEIDVKVFEGDDERLFFAVDFIETDGKKREREYFGIAHTVGGIYEIRAVNDRTAQSFKRLVFKSDIRAFYAQPMVSEEEGKKRAGRYFGSLRRWGREGEDTVLELRPFEIQLENGELNLSQLYETILGADFLKWKSKKAKVTPILMPANAGHPSGMTAYLKVEGDYVDKRQGRELVYLYFNYIELRLAQMTQPNYSALYNLFTTIRFSPNKTHFILAKESFRRIDPFSVKASFQNGIVWDDRLSQIQIPNLPIIYNGPVELSPIFDKADEPYLKVAVPNQLPRYFKMVNTKGFFEEVKADQIELAKQEQPPHDPKIVTANPSVHAFIFYYISALKSGTDEEKKDWKKIVEERWKLTKSFELDADENGKILLGTLDEEEIAITIPGLKKAKITPMSSYGKSFLTVTDAEASSIQGRIWYYSFSGESPYFEEREAPELDLMKLYIEATTDQNERTASEQKFHRQKIEEYKKYWRESEPFPVRVTQDGDEGVAHLGTVNGHEITIRVKGMTAAVILPKENYIVDLKKSHIFFQFAPIFPSDEDGRPKLENVQYYAFNNSPGFIEEAYDNGISIRIHNIENIANFMWFLEWKGSYKNEEEIKKKIADARERLRRVKSIRLQSDTGVFRLTGTKFNKYKNIHSMHFNPRVKEIEISVLWDKNDNPYFKVEFIDIAHGKKRTVYRGISYKVKFVPVNPDGSQHDGAPVLYPFDVPAKPMREGVFKESDWRPELKPLFNYYQAQLKRDMSLIDKKKEDLVASGSFEMDADDKGKLVFGLIGEYEVAIKIPGLRKARITPMVDIILKKPFFKVEALDIDEKKNDGPWYFWLEDIRGDFKPRLPPGEEEIHQFLKHLVSNNQARAEEYDFQWNQIQPFTMKAKKDGKYGVISFGLVNGEEAVIRLEGLLEAQITLKGGGRTGMGKPMLRLEGTFADGITNPGALYSGFIRQAPYMEEVNSIGENARTDAERVINYYMSTLVGGDEKQLEKKKERIIHARGGDKKFETADPKEFMRTIQTFRKRGKDGQFRFGSFSKRQFVMMFHNVNEIECKTLFDKEDNPYFEVTFTETTNGRKPETVYVGISDQAKFIRVNRDGSKIKTEWEEVKELAEIFSKPVQVLDANPGALLDVMLTLGPNYYKPEKMRRLVRRFHELNLRELHKKTKKTSSTGNAGVLLEFYFEQAKLINQKDERARLTLIEVYKNAAFHDLTKEGKKTEILRNLREGASKGKFFQELYEAVKKMVEVDMVFQPDHLRSYFEPYQAIGSYFLRGRERAFLGDPTGAGKTIEVLGALNPSEKNLIAMPAHLIENWRKEISRHIKKETLSNTEVIVISGNRAQRLQLMNSLRDKKNCIILFSISSMREHTKSEMAGLLHDLDLFVMDESQYVSNFKGFNARGNAKQAEIVQHIEAKRKWFLSATGYGSDPKQLFALLHSLTKGTPEHKNFEDYRTFIRLFPTDTPHGLRLLRAELRRIGLSRLQDEIMERYEDPNVTSLEKQGRRLPNVNEIPYEQMGGYTLNEEQVMLLFRMIYNFRDYAKWFNERVGPERQLNESNMHPFKKLQFIFDLMIDPKLVGGTTESPIYKELDKIMAHYAELKKKGILTRHHDYVLNAILDRYKDFGLTRIDGSGSEYAHKDGKVLKGYFENGELILDSDHPQARRISERLYQQYLFQKDPDHRINILQEQSGVGVDLTAAEFMVYIQLAKVFTRELQVDGRYIRPDESNARYMVDKIRMIAEFPENLMELLWGTPYFKLGYAMLKPGSKADLRLKELVKENDEWAEAVRLVKLETVKELKKKNKDNLHVNMSELRDIVDDPESLLNVLYENEIIDRNGFINDDFWRIDHAEAFQARLESPYDDVIEEKIFDALNAKLKGVGTPVEMQLHRLKVQEEIYKYLMTDLATRDEINLFNFGSFMRSIPGLMEDVTMDEYLNSLGSKSLKRTLDVFRELYFKADSMELQREILRIAESFFRSGQITVNNQLINLLKKGDETFTFLMGSLRDIPNKYARNQWAQRIIKMVTEDIPEEELNFSELLEDTEFLVDNAGFLILPLYEVTKGYQNGAAIQSMIALLSEVNYAYRDNYQKRQNIYHDVLLWMLAVDSDKQKGDKRDDLKLALEKYGEILTNEETPLNERLQMLQGIFRLISFSGTKEILLEPKVNGETSVLSQALLRAKVNASQIVFSLNKAEAEVLAAKFPALMTALQFQKTLLNSLGFERQTEQMNEMIRHIIAGDFDDWRNQQIGLRDSGAYVDYLDDKDKFWKIFTREDGMTLDGLEIDVDMNRKQISDMSARIYERITANNAKLVGDVDGEWVQHQFDNWSKRPISEFKKIGAIPYHLAKAKVTLNKGRTFNDLTDEQQDAIRVSHFDNLEDVDQLKKDIYERLRDFNRLRDWLTLTHWLASLERKPPKPEDIAQHRILLSKFIGRTDKLPIMISDELDNFSVALENINIRSRFNKLHIQFTTDPSLMIERGMFNAQLTDCFNCYADPQQFSTLIDDLGSRNKVLALVRDGGPDGRILARSVIKVKRLEDGTPVLFPERPLKIGNYPFENEIIKALYATKMKELKEFGVKIGLAGSFKDQRVKMFATGGYGDSEYVEALFGVRKHDRDVFHGGVLVTDLFVSQGTGLKPAGQPDQAQIASNPLKPKNPGGIDMNPRWMNFQMEGKGINFNFSLESVDWENMTIEGFSPVIINITPVTNLPLLLGIKKEEESMKLSRVQ